MGIVGSSLSPTTISVTGAAEPGDVNGDGSINVADAILTCRAAARIDSADQTLNLNADVDDDGKLGIAEALYILQKTAGLR